jgi:hypothetical protein
LWFSTTPSTAFPQFLWKTCAGTPANGRNARRSKAIVLALLLLLVAPASARAIEATVFVSSASPGDLWGGGYGASLTSTWFRVVTFDAELARQGYETADGRLLSFSVAAMLAPSFGRFTPYAGLGVGLFRESLGDLSDTGTLTSLIVGGKVRFGLLVLKAEYRTFNLSGTPLVDLSHRVYAGAGISF